MRQLEGSHFQLQVLQSADRFTYKFLSAGEVEELDETKVVSSHQAEAGVRNTSAVHVRFLSISRPNSENFVSQDTAKKTPESLLWRASII